MFKMAVAALICVSVSGCVGLNPEHDMINQLKGKDVNEARGFLFSTMGNPVYEPTPGMVKSCGLYFEPQRLGISKPG